MHERYLLLGGLVAMGIDPSGRYLLAVSHSGRGVFDTSTWERVARDYSLAYPVKGIAIGIGPIDGQQILVAGVNLKKGTLDLESPGGDYLLSYEYGTITVRSE